MALLKSIDSCAKHYDKEIGSIVEEAAPTYYPGQKSAEEVVLIMESRISLILDKRKNSQFIYTVSNGSKPESI